MSAKKSLAVWSKNRHLYDSGTDTYCCTSKDFMHDIRAGYRLGGGGPIDAPDHLPAGSVTAGIIVDSGTAVRRGGV